MIAALGRASFLTGGSRRQRDTFNRVVLSFLTEH